MFPTAALPASGHKGWAWRFMPSQPPDGSTPIQLSVTVYKDTLFPIHITTAISALSKNFWKDVCIRRFFLAGFAAMGYTKAGCGPQVDS